MAVVTINGLFVPVRGKAEWVLPDPQDAGKKTIEGIDSDKDCVRDDIENFIAQKISKEGSKGISFPQIRLSGEK